MENQICRMKIFFGWKLFEISNHHAHRHYHKQVTIWCLPCGGHHILTPICFIAGVIGCSPPFGVPCSWEFFFFSSKKDSLEVSFTFHSVLFFCIISLKSNSLNVTSKNFKNKVRISGPGKDNGSFTSTKFRNRFLAALQLEIPC